MHSVETKTKGMFVIKKNTNNEQSKQFHHDEEKKADCCKLGESFTLITFLNGTIIYSLILKSDWLLWNSFRVPLNVNGIANKPIIEPPSGV